MGVATPLPPSNGTTGYLIKSHDLFCATTHYHNNAEVTNIFKQVSYIQNFKSLAIDI